MAKSFKHFRIQFGTKSGQHKSNKDDKPIYKHSLYMQSRDDGWINRNIKDDSENIEIDGEEDLPE